ncbi:MAG: hypothetical protein AB7W16_09365 [Candidatus Obscuribacterales bacterium]
MPPRIRKMLRILDALEPDMTDLRFEPLPVLCPGVELLIAFEVLDPGQSSFGVLFAEGEAPASVTKDPGLSALLADLVACSFGLDYAAIS